MMPRGVTNGRWPPQAVIAGFVPNELAIEPDAVKVEPNQENSNVR